MLKILDSKTVAILSLPERSYTAKKIGPGGGINVFLISSSMSVIIAYQSRGMYDWVIKKVNLSHYIWNNIGASIEYSGLGKLWGFEFKFKTVLEALKFYESLN